MKYSIQVRAVSLRRGSALIPALFVVILVAVLAMAYLQLSLDKNRESKMSVDAKRAFYIAEAGLSEAFYGLAAGQSGNVGSASLPARFANGVFWVKAQDVGTDKVTLTSVGLCGAGRSAVAVTLQKGASSIGALGVFSDRDVTVSSGVVVDSYDSRKGPYVPAGPWSLDGNGFPAGARVGSNSNIYAQGASGGRPPAQIFGDARPGPTGSVLRGSNTLITGSTAPSPAPEALPAIIVPVIASSGTLDLQRAGKTTLPSGERAYDKLHVYTGSALVVPGPATIVLGSLVLDPGAQLTFDGTNGAVKLYVADWMKLASGSILNTTSTATGQVTLLVAAKNTIDRDGDGVSDPPVSFDAGGSFYGSIYVPGAVVTLPATFTLYGAVAAAKLTLASGAQEHFDRALIDAPAVDGSLPRLVAWRLLDLPRSELVAMHFDPLNVLKLNGITPTRARDAHHDKGEIVDETPLSSLIKPSKGND